MQVEIWSDIVCPWCVIGKARFDEALATFPHADDVVVRWRSFELDPSAPPVVGGTYVERLMAKYGTSSAQAQQRIDHMTEQAAGDGLTFRFDKAQPGNTFAAHRLLHLAADRGLQHEVQERLMAGYMSEGLPIGDPAALQKLATEAGLDEVEVKEVLAGDAYAEAVRADERQAAAYGINGVPFFVLDGRLGLSGAQPASVIRRALDEAWSTGQPLTMMGTQDNADAPHAGHDDAVCADGSCAI